MTVPSPAGRARESAIVAFVLTVPSEEAELAADRLWQLGVRGVEERPHRADESAGGGPPKVELWTSLGDDPATAIADLALPQNWTWRTERVTPTDTWRDHARPICVSDRLVIVPAWQDVPATVDDRLILSIEPGGAFGLGDHPTTSLSLGALLDVFDALGVPRQLGDWAAPSVLDVGCGTGLLAIAAARLGAGRVRAIDVSPAAIEATDDNSRRNQVEHVVAADRTPCSRIEGAFEVVIANILAPVLVALAADLSRLVAPDGRLIISGVLHGGYDHVLAALVPMVVERIDHRDGWAAITLRHDLDRSVDQRVDPRARSSSI